MSSWELHAHLDGYRRRRDGAFVPRAVLRYPDGSPYLGMTDYPDWVLDAFVPESR
jgi:hypothetical protein